MNAPHLADLTPTRALSRWWTVGTFTGLRFHTLATTAADALAKVHGAVSAWEGLEPLGQPANDNAGRP